MNKYISIFVGLVLLIVPIYAGISNLFGFGSAALVVLKGSVTWGILLIGLVLLLTGIMGLKDN